MAEVFKEPVTKVSTPLLYNPDKVYRWEPKDKFVLDGIEFAQIYQLVKNDVFINGGTSIKQKMDVFVLLENILQAAVEAGVAVEQVPPTPPPGYISSENIGEN